MSFWPPPIPSLIQWMKLKSKKAYPTTNKKNIEWDGIQLQLKSSKASTTEKVSAQSKKMHGGSKCVYCIKIMNNAHNFLIFSIDKKNWIELNRWGALSRSLCSCCYVWSLLMLEKLKKKSIMKFVWQIFTLTLTECWTKFFFFFIYYKYLFIWSQVAFQMMIKKNKKNFNKFFMKFFDNKNFLLDCFECLKFL